MDIQKWLNSDETKVNLDFQFKANELLILYVQGLHEALNIDMTANTDEFIRNAKEQMNDRATQMFIKWVEVIGIPTLKKINDLQLELYPPILEKIDFMKRIIKTELDWCDKTSDSTITCLMNSVTNLDKELIELHQICLESEQAATNKVNVDVDLQVEIEEELLLIYEILGYNELGIMTTDRSSLFIYN